MTGPANEEPVLPAVIQHWVDGLHHHTGQMAEVKRVSKRLWRLTIANERVCMTMDFKQNSKGRVRRGNAILTVDGKPRRLAHDIYEFVRIFRDPDEKPEIPPMPPLRPVTEAPQKVQHVYHHMARRIRKVSEAKEIVATLQLGSDDRRWTICLEVDNVIMRVHFVRGKSKTWRADARDPIQLFVDGEDYLDETMSDLGKVLEMILGDLPGPQTEDSSPIRSSAGPARRVKSVEVRNTTVIRN